MKKPHIKMPEIHFGDYMLRTIKRSDAKNMFEYGKDPEVTKYLNWGPFILLSEAKQTIKFIYLPRIKEELPIGYAIVDVVINKMIGTIDFHSKIKGVNGIEIGYVLHRDYWNKGIMSQALKEMIKIGFDYLNYDVLRIKHLVNNEASRHVILKSGFKFKEQIPYTHEKQKTVIKDEMLIYELLKEDYHVSQQG